MTFGAGRSVFISLALSLAGNYNLSTSLQRTDNAMSSAVLPQVTADKLRHCTQDVRRLPEIATK
jgi:hypothetical protein